MSRDVDKAELNFYKLRDSEWFEANSSGISQLKMMTRQDAHEFLYLRKGEDFGGVMQMLFELMSQSPEVIQATYSMYLSHIPEIASEVSLDALLEVDWAQVLAFYLIITKVKELVIRNGEALKSWWENIRKGKPTPSIPYLRIICNPDDVNERARIGWESMGYEVRHYADPKQAGSHRYYLSEKSYCFFIRKPDSTFFGFRGSDPSLINELKSQFEQEWHTAIIPA